MIVFGTPAMAQSEAESAIKNVESILKSNAPDKDKQIATIAKGFKKDPKTLIAIGRKYFNAANYEKAGEYANQALAIDKKKEYYGEAYILLGDAAAQLDDGGLAAEHYAQAMHFDKTNPEGYRGYARTMSKVSPKQSAAALEELRKNVPDYPVDIISAEIFDKAGDRENAILYYEKVDRNKMKDNQFVNYLSCLFFTHNYDKVIEQGEWGVTKFPTSPAIPRLTFYSHTEKQNYGKAVEFAEKLFNISDSVKILPYDLQYYGHAAMGNKNFDKAIDLFNQLAEHPDANTDAKRDALKNIAENYLERENYPKAIEAYKKYLSVAGDNASANDYAAYGRAYMYHAQNLDGAEKTNAIKEADKIFADLEAKKPNAAAYANYQRANLANVLDPNIQQGLAKPFYDKVIALIPLSSDLDESSKTYLKTAYYYNMSYSLHIKKNTAEAKEYAAKILAIDPDFEPAQQVNNM